MRDHTKLLSVVVIGRNDDYMGNFTYRLSTSVNYLARNLAELGRLDDVEILVTDWASDVPLAQVLPLRPEAQRICRFLYVPPALARSRRPKGFFPSCAQNASLRRGRGRYLMAYDADSLMPRHATRNLLELLDGKIAVPFDRDRALLFLCRHHVPWEVVQRELTVEGWDRYLLHGAGSLPRDPGTSGAGGSGAGMLMHRSIWHATRGFDETMQGAGWTDSELMLRVNQKYPWIDLSFSGINLFHMEHWPHNRRGQWQNAIINPQRVSMIFEANDEGWGLGGEVVEEQGGRVAPPAERADEGPPSWDQTVRSLAADMTAAEVAEHVTQSAQLPVTTAPLWESLCALAWYGLRHYPGAYLEYGLQEQCAAAVVAASCPGVEIYGVDSWRKEDGTPLEQVLVLLREVGYSGYTHLMTGDEATAFARLREAVVQPLRIDLALVRLDLLGDSAVSQVGEMAGHLTPGGMLVLTGPSREQLDQVWQALATRCPEHALLRAASGMTGVVIAARLAGDAREGVVDFGPPRTPSLKRRLLKVARQAYHKLRAR